MIINVQPKQFCFIFSSRRFLFRQILVGSLLGLLSVAEKESNLVLKGFNKRFKPAKYWCVSVRWENADTSILFVSVPEIFKLMLSAFNII